METNSMMTKRKDMQKKHMAKRNHQIPPKKEINKMRMKMKEKKMEKKSK